MRLRKDIYRLGFLISGIVLLSFFITALFPEHTRRILAVMMILVGLVSFYGFIGLGVNAKDSNLSKSDIRLAIVISTLTFYFSLVGATSTFITTIDERSPEITGILINHFTNIVGIVIAFYF